MRYFSLRCANAPRRDVIQPPGYSIPIPAVMYCVVIPEVSLLISGTVSNLLSTLELPLTLSGTSVLVLLLLPFLFSISAVDAPSSRSTSVRVLPSVREEYMDF